MTRPLTFRYDPHASAVYIYVGGTGFRIASKTVSLADDVMVDLDQDGKVIGVEILGVAEPKTDIIGTRPAQGTLAKEK